MPGNCGAEARSFRNSTNWFREESYFSMVAASTEQTERVVKTKTSLTCEKALYLVLASLENKIESLLAG